MRIFYISKIKIIRFLIFAVIVASGICFYAFSDYDSVSVFLNTKRELPIYSVETDKKVVAISFDAAWGCEYTDTILNILDERNIKSTFFLVGFWIDKHPDMVKKIAEAGHDVGNHSSTHPHMSELNRQQIINELQETQKKIDMLAGDQPIKLFRPPFGDYNNTLITTCNELNIYPIQWDVDSLDWKEYGEDHIVKQVTSKVQNGSIILFHNNAKYTTKALPRVLDYLDENGYKVIPISDIIIKNNYYIDHTGRQKSQ